MKKNFCISILLSIFSTTVFTSDPSTQPAKIVSLKERYHLTPSEMYEKIKEFPKNERSKAREEYARVYLARNINTNLAPYEIADQLNTLFDNPLFKNLLSIRIKSNVNGTIQHVGYQRCFLKGAKGQASMSRWIAPGYSSQK